MQMRRPKFHRLGQKNSGQKHISHYQISVGAHRKTQPLHLLQRDRVQCQNDCKARAAVPYTAGGAVEGLNYSQNNGPLGAPQRCRGETSAVLLLVHHLLLFLFFCFLFLILSPFIHPLSSLLPSPVPCQILTVLSSSIRSLSHVALISSFLILSVLLQFHLFLSLSPPVHYPFSFLYFINHMSSRFLFSRLSLSLIFPLSPFPFPFSLFQSSMPSLSITFTAYRPFSLLIQPIFF